MTERPDYQRCQDCVFYSHEDPSPTMPGKCRRHPPVHDGAYGVGQFPKVHSGDWCGEWSNEP